MTQPASWLADFFRQIVIMWNGTPVNRRSNLNFTGGVTVSDDPTNDRTNVAISTGGAPTGTGIAHVLAGAFVSPATPIVNADVDAAAAIAVTKVATGSLDGQVLRRSGGVNAFGAVDLANANAVTGVLPAGNQASQVTWANDLSGSNNTHQWVGGISGTGGAGGSVPVAANLNVTATHFVFFGTTPSTSGHIRFPKASVQDVLLTSLINSGAADMILIQIDTSDNLFIGDATRTQAWRAESAASWGLVTGSSYYLLGTAASSMVAHGFTDQTWQTVGGLTIATLTVATAASFKFRTDATTAEISYDAATPANPLVHGITTGGHQIRGAVAHTTRSTASSFTVDTTTTDHTIFLDTSGATKTVTLPTPTAGRELVLIDSTGSFGTNNCTLARHASEKINGSAASLVLAADWGIYRIYSDGVDWWCSQ